MSKKKIKGHIPTHEEIVLNGRRNAIPRKFMAMSVAFINAWLEAGHEVKDRKGKVVEAYDPIDVKAGELRWISDQWMRVKKWRDAYLEEVGDIARIHKSGNSFFDDLNADIELMQTAARARLGDSASYTDELRVTTYLFAAVVHDWCNIMHPERRSMLMFRQTLETLANHIITKDSPLVLPMSQAWLDTRDIVLADLPVPASYFDVENTSTEQELWATANRWKNDTAREQWKYIHTAPKETRRKAA